MKSYSLFLMLILFLFKDSHSKRHRGRGRNHGKIVGGYDTTIQDAPYQAYLLLYDGDDYYQCGGSIISEEYILTAAHCLEGIEEAFVRVGSTDADDGGTEVSSTELTIHPDYDSGSLDYDVAIIHLSEALDLDGTNTRATQIADEDTSVEPGTTIRVTGWGATSEGGDVSETLMAVEVEVVSNEDCNNALGGITDNMICAGVPEGGKDSCQGDSGGPAVSVDDEIQRGIVSFGVGCARKGYPGVYTNIASVREWIRSIANV